MPSPLNLNSSLKDAAGNFQLVTNVRAMVAMTYPLHQTLQ